MDVCIAFSLVVGFLVIIVVASSSSSSSSSSSATTGPAPAPVVRNSHILGKGRHAYGILLKVDPTGTRVRSNLAPPAPGLPPPSYEQRQVTIDVEVPGELPYVTTTSLLIPGNMVRDVLPGAAVELRVSPDNPNDIAVVGPGTGFGFAAPAPAAPTTTPAAAGTPRTAAAGTGASAPRRRGVAGQSPWQDFKQQRGIS